MMPFRASTNDEQQFKARVMVAISIAIEATRRCGETINADELTKHITELCNGDTGMMITVANVMLASSGRQSSLSAVR